MHHIVRSVQAETTIKMNKCSPSGLTSGMRSRNVSYMSSSTNSFSGDFLLLATESPKLSSVAMDSAATSQKTIVRSGSSR
jgi:hypothetical protein